MEPEVTIDDGYLRLECEDLTLVFIRSPINGTIAVYSEGRGMQSAMIMGGPAGDPVMRLREWLGD